MNKAVPWSIKGVDFDARTAAKEAARRAGMTLGEWLNSVIAEQAAEQGVDPDEIGEDERVAAVRNRLERMSPSGPAPQTGGLRRRTDRGAASRARASEYDDASDDEYFDRAPPAAKRVRAPILAREVPFSRGRPADYPDYDDTRPLYRSGTGADALLDDAVRSFERRTRRDNAETSAALDSVARRLESIEGRLESKHSQPDADRSLKRVISRLESRMEAIASREETPPASAPQDAVPMAVRHYAPPPQFTPEVQREPVFQPQVRAEPVMAPAIQAEPAFLHAPAPVAAPAAQSPGMRSSDLARIEAKLNRLLEREAQPAVMQPAITQPAMALHPMTQAASAAGLQAPEGFYRAAPGVPPTRRPLHDAIAEINRRQADLDRGFTRAGSSFAPPRAAARNIQQAVSFAAAMPEAPPSEIHSELRNTVTSLKSEIADLSRHIEVMRRDNANPETIATSDREAFASNSVAPELDGLRRQITDMSAAIGKLAPRESLSSLEAAIRQLGEQVTHSRREDGRDTYLAPVEQLIAEMKTSLSDFAPRSAVSAIEREIQAINRNIETMAQSGVDPVSFAKACEQTAEIRNLLAAAVARPLPLENIEKQLASLGKRVDLIATRGPTPVGMSAVNESVGEIRAAMQDATPAPFLLAIEERIEELARKIDEAAARPAPANGQLDAISQRLDTMQQTLAWQSERQPVAKVDTTALEGMLQQIMERVNKPAPAAAMAIPDLDTFEKSLRDLATRVDNIAKQPEFDGLSGLEERITSLASKLERPELSGSATGHVERTLNHLVTQLEENRLSAIDAASNAARSAARDVLEEFSRSGMNPAASLEGAKELIAREISGLRSLQDASDRRTHATLGAVHETLEKVVDRLAMLEEDIGEREPRENEVFARNAAAAEERFSSGPAPVFAKSSEAPQQSAKQQPSPANPAAAASAELKAAASAPPVQPPQQAAPQQAAPRLDAPIAPPVQPAKVSMGDDFLIEPGSGKKPSRNAIAAAPAFNAAPSVPSAAAAQHHPETPAAVDDPHSQDSQIPGRNSASNFIAAARRAQQAAQTRADVEAAQQPPPKRGIKSLSPDNALAEARSRAKAAASLLSGSFKKGAKPTEKDETVAAAAVANASPTKGRSLFSSRKVLFSLAGLVLVLGALTIIRQNMMRSAPPRPVAAAPAAPAQQAELNRASAPVQTSAPENSPVAATPAPQLAAPPLSASQFTTGPARPATAAPAQANAPSVSPALPAEQRTDRAPVSSIPSLASSAATPSANNLQMAAAGGDPSAQYELAIRMADGRAENRDPAAAAQLLEKAAAKGLAPAQYRLGSLFEKGIGVEKNLAQARHWYEQAATAGNVKAMHNFAVLLAEGGDGKPDYATAANWFKRAAEHGVRDSQYNLAILYARGLGIEQSMVDAYQWLALAEAQGDSDAGAKRTDVTKRLTPGQLSEANDRVKRFRAQKAQPASNEVTVPPGGWSTDATTARAPLMVPPARAIIPGNEQIQQRTPAAKRPKVSSL